MSHARRNRKHITINWSLKIKHTNRHVLHLCMWILDPPVVKCKHAMKWFSEDEDLKTYPDGNDDGKANVISSIGLL